MLLWAIPFIFLACMPFQKPHHSESPGSRVLADAPNTPKTQSIQSENLSAEAIDRMISERERRNLTSLQSHPYHKNKTREQLAAMAQVGKSDFHEFWTAIRRAAPMDPLTRDELQAQSIHQEYKRIWYLADDSYKATRSKKFQPDLALTPYLLTQVPRHFINPILVVLKEELDRESKDPRALGHECSEMLKLQSMIQTLSSTL